MDIAHTGVGKICSAGYTGLRLSVVFFIIVMDSGSLKRSCARALTIAWLHTTDPLVPCIRTGDCRSWIHDNRSQHKKGE